MATVILDEELAERLKAERAERGGDRYDEVWEGVYMMAAMPNNEHQFLVIVASRGSWTIVIHDSGSAKPFPAVMLVIERIGRHNFRVPGRCCFLKRDKSNRSQHVLAAAVRISLSKS